MFRRTFSNCNSNIRHPANIGHFPSELEVRHSSYKFIQYGKILYAGFICLKSPWPVGSSKNQTLRSLLTKFETLRLGSPGKDMNPKLGGFEYCQYNLTNTVYDLYSTLSKGRKNISLGSPGKDTNPKLEGFEYYLELSLIHIWRCRRRG